MANKKQTLAITIQMRLDPDDQYLQAAVILNVKRAVSEILSNLKKRNSEGMGELDDLEYSYTWVPEETKP